MKKYKLKLELRTEKFDISLSVSESVLLVTKCSPPVLLKRYTLG